MNNKSLIAREIERQKQSATGPFTIDGNEIFDSDGMGICLIAVTHPLYELTLQSICDALNDKLLLLELAKLAPSIFAAGYSQGHNDTVESCYTHVYPQDAEEYFWEQMKEVKALTNHLREREKERGLLE